MEKTIAILALAAVLLAPAISGAQEEERVKTWAFSLRLGGFSTSSYLDRHSHPDVQAAAGLEFTSYFDRRSAISIAVDALSFPGGFTAVVPITAGYKFYPAGNGSIRVAGAKRSPVLPWIGGGAGIYVFGPGWGTIARINAGAFASAGVQIPLGSIFSIDGEMRYSFTSDLRFLSYTLGLGFRF